jgi:hypothetical protein
VLDVDVNTMHVVVRESFNQFGHQQRGEQHAIAEDNETKVLGVQDEDACKPCSNSSISLFHGGNTSMPVLLTTATSLYAQPQHHDNAQA